MYDGYLCLNMAYAETASTVYNLEGRYAAFSGVFTSSSDSVGSASVNISIYGDGELLFEEKDYQKADGPLAFTVDVTGKPLWRSGRKLPRATAVQKFIWKATA